MSGFDFAGKHTMQTSSLPISSLQLQGDTPVHLVVAFLLCGSLVCANTIAEPVKSTAAETGYSLEAILALQTGQFTASHEFDYPEKLNNQEASLAKIDFSLVSTDYVKSGFASTGVAINQQHARKNANDGSNPGTDFLNMPPGHLLVDKNENDLYNKKGTAALGSLFRMGFKSWWYRDSSSKLHGIAEKTPEAIRQQGIASSSNLDWDYSIKLSGDDIKLKLEREF